MIVTLIGGITMMLVWLFLAFGIAISSGWVHVPLAIAAVLFARAIVLGDGRTPERPES